MERLPTWEARRGGREEARQAKHPGARCTGRKRAQPRAIGMSLRPGAEAKSAQRSLAASSVREELAGAVRLSDEEAGPTRELGEVPRSRRRSGRYEGRSRVGAAQLGDVGCHRRSRSSGGPDAGEAQLDGWIEKHGPARPAVGGGKVEQLGREADLQLEFLPVCTSTPWPIYG